MLDLRTTNRFKKDVKKVERQGRPMAKLGEVIERLRKEEPLEPHQGMSHPLLKPEVVLLG